MLCLCGFELYSRWVPLGKDDRRHRRLQSDVFYVYRRLI